MTLRALTCWLAFSVATIVAAAQPDRPNILCLVSEDNDTFLGCYGDKLARTPTLDKLSREGVTYERCFTCPVCAPSRFNIIAGMSPETCGPAQHMRAQGNIPSWLRGFPALLREAGYFTSNNAKTDYNSPISIKDAWTAQGKQAHWRANRDKSKPFFSVFNHEVTHESCLFPEKELAFDFVPLKPSEVRIPPYQPDTPEIRADWARYYNHMLVMDGQIAAKLRDLEKDGLAENTIVFYYGDNGGVLPRSKRFLQQSGVQVPLIVYYPPKWRHLAPAAPGTHINEPVHFVDFAPTMLSLAGVKIPEYMQGRALAGSAKAAPVEYVFTTRDRMDSNYDMMRGVVGSRYLYIRNFRPDLPYVQRLEYMFQARGYQSWAREAAAGRLTAATAQFWGKKPAEELYDMESDPDSIHNLASSPEHRATMEKMRAALLGQTLRIKDNGLLPEGSPLEGYDASRAPGAWDVEKVYALACQASDRDPANLPQFIAALGDPSEPMRWWGAQGCTILGPKAAEAEAALKAALNDKSGAVAAAAAEALARIGKPAEALGTLEQLIQLDGNDGAVMIAANVLDRLGEAARPSLPAMKKAFAKEASAKLEGGKYAPTHLLKHAIDVLEGRVDALVYPEPGK
jgi:arylsulfatase A-like enzyme